MTSCVSGFVDLAVDLAVDVTVDVVVSGRCWFVSDVVDAEVVVVIVVFVMTALSASFVLLCRLAVGLKFVTVVVVNCYFDVAHFATVEVVFVVRVEPSFKLLLPDDLLLSVYYF